MKTPTKGTSDYFVGELADESTTLRFVGFDPKQQLKISQSQNKPISLINCEVKKSLYKADNFEILVSPSTSVAFSPRRLDVSSLSPSLITADPPAQSLHITLDNVLTTENFKVIDTYSKVIKISHTVEVKPELRK